MITGPWSDSHGRRRRPLIFLPIMGQVLTDSLCILNVYFWNWPPHIAAIFEAITPGLFGARSVFWIGIISYISDNCSIELRTLKYGVINAIYTISNLVGAGLAGFLNVDLGFYGAFMVSIILNLIAILIGYFFLKDNSKPYDKNAIWLKPKYFFQNYLNVLQKDSKLAVITFLSLLLSQGVLVGRIVGKLIVNFYFLNIITIISIILKNI